MSKSIFLEKLLDKAEVKWVPLGELTKIKSGQAVNKTMIAENPGDYPVINSGREPLGYIDQWNTENDPIGITSRGAGVGSITWREGRYYRGNLNYSVSIEDGANVRTKFLLHLLLYMQREIQDLCTYDGIPALNASNLKQLLLPIPCPENPEKSLAIQAEIVRILDTFTELTAELTAELISELTARKKQFNYYRDQLLTFEEGDIEWKTLGEVGEFVRGKRFVKADMISEGVPCIHYGEMYTHYGIWADKAKSCVTSELVKKNKLRTAEKGNVVMVAAGETIEDIGMGTAWLSDEGVVIHDACFTYRSGLNPKYVAYFTRTKFFQSQVRKSVSSGKISAINAKGLSKVTIPIPSIAEQARIVGILDKFDTLTHSISEGLPREIELRQKQYEYYRDLLLNFPKTQTKGVA